MLLTVLNVAFCKALCQDYWCNQTRKDESVHGTDRPIAQVGIRCLGIYASNYENHLRVRIIPASPQLFSIILRM